MALLTIDGRQEENFSDGAYRPDGQLNIPSQAAADAMRKEFRAFEAAENARLEQGNPSAGDPFPQRGVQYLSGPREGTVPTLQEIDQYEQEQQAMLRRIAFENAMLEDRNPSKGDPFPQSNFAYDDGTVPTLQEMAQYEEYQKTQDAMESGIPRADNTYSPEYRARMDANLARQAAQRDPFSGPNFDNFAIRTGKGLFSTIGDIAKQAITGEGTAKSAFSSWDKYAGGRQAALLLGGMNDLGQATLNAVMGGLTTGIGVATEMVPFMSENQEDRASKTGLALLEFAEQYATPFYGGLSQLAQQSSRLAKTAPVRVGAQTPSQGGLVEAAGRGAETNLGPTGRPLSTVIPTEGRGAVRVEARPIAEIQNAASRYMKERGIDAGDGYDVTGYPELNKDRARLVAAAYQQMKDDPTNPAVRRAYEALIEETLGQLRALDKTGIELDFLAPNTPYPYGESPAMGYGDIVTNKRLVTFPTRSGYGTGTTADDFEVANNPLLRNVGRVGTMDDATANDAFRVVHDAYGHFGPGNPFFRSKGEERAFLEHRRMFSDDARPAMASETTGQNSYLNYGPDEIFNTTASGETTKYAPQKIGIMPDWATDPTGMPDGAELRRLQKIVNEWRKENG